MSDFHGFDPSSLLTTVVRAKFDTKVPPIPIDQCDEFHAICNKVEVRPFTSSKTGKDYLSLDTTWEILDEGVKAATGMPHPTARYSVFLDLDDRGQLDTGTGKNVSLGRLLEAVSLNKEGSSLSQLQGLTAWVRIKHRPNPEEPEVIYNEVSRVSAAPKGPRVT
jgi:hypothetical protein